MKNQNRKIFITVGLVLLLNVAFFAIWIFLFSQINTRMVSIDEMRSQIKSNEVSTAAYKKIELGAGPLSEKRGKLESIFVNQGNIVIFIEKLEEVGRQSGASLDLISTEPKEGAKTGHTFRFDTIGTFSQVYKFLNLLENIPYEISIDNFALQKTGETWKASFNITLVSFI